LTPPSPATVRPRSPLRETAPDLGAGPVGAQIVHVDAVLAHQRQDILAGADQAFGARILQRAAQRAEAFLVMLVLGEIHRLDEIGDRDRVTRFGLREGEASAAALRDRRFRLGHGRARFGRRKGAERGEGRRLARIRHPLRGEQFLEPAHDLGLDVERRALLLFDIGDAHGVDGGLQPVRLLPERPRGPGRHRDHPDQRDRQQDGQHGEHGSRETARPDAAPSPAPLNPKNRTARSQTSVITPAMISIRVIRGSASARA
jgi:hypothetical protein